MREKKEMAKIVFARPWIKLLESETKQRMVKFVAIGVGLFFLGDIMLFFIVTKNNVPIKIGYPTITLILYIIQYLLHSKITWKDRKTDFRGNLKRLATYFPAKAVLWAYTQGIFTLWYFVGTSDWNPVQFEHRIANVLTTVTIMMLSYFVLDKLVFKKKGEA